MFEATIVLLTLQAGEQGQYPCYGTELNSYCPCGSSCGIGCDENGGEGMGMGIYCTDGGGGN